MRQVPTCQHRLTKTAEMAILACADCDLAEFWCTTGRLDPTEAIARLFGEFELDSTLEGIGAPSPVVLAYRPTRPADAQRLRAFPAHRWLRIDGSLWLCHDGRTLLLAPVDVSLARSFG